MEIINITRIPYSYNEHEVRSYSNITYGSYFNMIMEFYIEMDSDYLDEEGLLKVIKAFELSEAITRLNWNWNNYSNPIKDAHELIAMSQKLFIEISEYEQRVGSKLGEYQKNKIHDAIEDLGKVSSYIKNKIKPSEILEIVD